MSNSAIGDAIRTFLDKQAWNPGTFGDKPDVPTDAELELLAAFGKSQPITAADVQSLHGRLNEVDPNRLIGFSLRMAIYGVRTNNPSALVHGVQLLAFEREGSMTDPRDMPRGLVIIEMCARRLGIDLLPLLREVTVLVSPGRRQIFERYMGLPPKERLPEAHGFAASGSGSSFRVTLIPNW